MIVGGVLVIGLAVVVMKSLTPENVAAPAQQSTPAPKPAPTGCPIDGPEQLEGRLDVAPAAAWMQSGETTFPVPLAADKPASGVWECFARTPEGAVFAAAAGTSQLTDPNPELRRLVIEQRVKHGDVRDSMLESLNQASTTQPSSSSLRMRVAGFRLVDYDGTTARVDVAFTASGKGNTASLSMLVPLQWDEKRGDWLFAYGPYDQLPPAQLPNISGYVQWPADTPGVIPGG